MNVTVFGAGYAGVTLAQQLESSLCSDIELTVIDDSDTHLLKHEVHRVIRRPRVADIIEVPLTTLFDRATVQTAHIQDIDIETQTAQLNTGTTHEYDYGAICLGSVTADYDIPGVAEHGLPLNTTADALAIRTALFEAAGVMSTADSSAEISNPRQQSPSDININPQQYDAVPTNDTSPVDIVVGGAGLSGIQTAGELAALANEAGIQTNITLIEQQPTVAPNFPENFQSAVSDALSDNGVRTSTATIVERACENIVKTDTGEFDADIFVWTGGIRGTDAMDKNRPTVQSDLRAGTRTFIVGDAGRGIDADGESIPASAAAALREARTVADNLSQLVEYDINGGGGFEPRLDPYRFEVPGWIVTIGDDTVAQLGPEVLTGSAAKAMKASVGAGHLSSVGALTQAAELVDAEIRSSE
ncbi:NAD(P)/FAD-dependent oxidoreductase [Haloquadratum walsbyi]|uniref:Probable NADH dehydrogenase n=1 Tax=Haloquadratum walsbyi (strain DSM 16854 / JCM 12705 / C23) TaxID=768065 RepID=G0LGL4_HALWC|nr:FAD-dependent oxidoreductase [Haloquadratum walsbyi]CCC39566.1 probable NADH dehydrogenase [Haloquadratum walsbyi C23]